MRTHSVLLALAGFATGCAMDELAIGELEHELVLESDKLMAPQPLWDDWFGWSIVLDGDLMVVGAPWKNQVHVFVNQGGWQLVQTLEPSLGGLGAELALDGDRLAVTGETSDRWAVHIFDRVDGESWIETATILAPYPDWVYDPYLGGMSIGLEGDHLVVGHAYDDDGVAFAYHREPDGTWILAQKISRPHPSDRYFGMHLAMSDGRLLVAEQSHAHIFRLEASGLWKEEALLTQDGDCCTGDLVYSLDLDGDLAMVGFQGGDYQPDLGEVRIYKRINGAWNNIQGLLLPDPTAIDIDGTTAAVGAREASCGRGTMQTGCAYIFRAATWTRTTWGLVETLKPSDGVALDLFGAGIAQSGAVTAVGAPHPGEANHAGAVYLFDL